MVAVGGRTVPNLVLDRVGEADQRLRLDVDVSAGLGGLSGRVHAGEEELLEVTERRRAEVRGRVAEHLVDLLVRVVGPGPARVPEPVGEAVQWPQARHRLGRLT